MLAFRSGVGKLTYKLQKTPLEKVVAATRES